jgi:hypothetical protein
MSASERPGCVPGVDPGFSWGVAAVRLAGDVVLTAATPVTKGKGSKTEPDVPGLVDLVCGLECC